MIASKLKTIKYMCDDCSHTHVFLGPLVIPYTEYSLPTVLWILCDYYSGKMTVKEICSKYGIVPRMLYRWKETFQKHKDLYLGELNDIETSAAEFLKWIMNLQDFRAFFEYFKEMTPDHRCFMQKHKNAQNMQFA